jgi:hypothetical protein
MKTLPVPLRATVDDLDFILARKREPLLGEMTAARQAILDLFAGYIDKGGWDFDTLQPLDHIPGPVRKALLGAYGLTYTGKSLASLRVDLLSVLDGVCPYCRLMPATTLDHFLPKSLHEPFAVFAPNLVPMCSVCNTYKGTKGSAKARQFFTHAYFDRLAEGERFLVAQVAVGARHIATNFAIDFS